ncbi:YdeI/OmpD-associated family protein [Nocardia sp. IBHARD005]|uniref:YdeI/OmpD-associated family protein n=1 Tax=Nocardia sp. IBHARD005 TaxID=3457765 RepID=UPI004059A626
MTSYHFTTQIELGGQTATGFRVPADIVDALGQGKRPRVFVTIGPHTYRSTVAVYGGEFMLPLNASNRDAAGVSAGDTTEVTVELDREERTIEVPDDLAQALEQHRGSTAAFAALSYSKQRERVQSVTAAKRPDTRKSRIAKIITELTDT